MSRIELKTARRSRRRRGIRKNRPPEPYNGKGIKNSDEIVLRKQGKVFGS